MPLAHWSCVTFFCLHCNSLNFISLCAHHFLSLWQYRVIQMSEWKSFVCASMRVLRLFPRTPSSVVNNRSCISLSGDIFARSLSHSHSFDLSLWEMLVVYVLLCSFFSLSLSKRCAVLQLLLWSISVCHPLPVGRTRSGPEDRVS